MSVHICIFSFTAYSRLFTCINIWHLLNDIMYLFQEHFLVPDHTIKDISGASFAGFYYICFQKSSATIEGYYYHRSSEW